MKTSAVFGYVRDSTCIGTSVRVCVLIMCNYECVCAHVHDTFIHTCV
jgi:hypothetical protein